MRILGTISLIFGVGGFIYAVAVSYFDNLQIDQMGMQYGVFSGAYYFVFGLALVLFSGPLGRLLGSGLDDPPHE